MKKPIIIITTAIVFTIALFLIFYYWPSKNIIVDFGPIKKAATSSNKKFAILVAECLANDPPTKCGKNDLESIRNILLYNNFHDDQICSILITNKFNNGGNPENSLKSNILRCQKMDVDQLVIYYSGHGGQTPDLSFPPDEIDGQDEYLTLGGDTLLDDTINVLLNQFDLKTKIIFITDCCHSGTNDKAINNFNSEKLTIEIKKVEYLHLAAVLDENSAKCLPDRCNSQFTASILKILKNKTTYSELIKKLKEDQYVCNSNYISIDSLSFINDYIF